MSAEDRSKIDGAVYVGSPASVALGARADDGQDRVMRPHRNGRWPANLLHDGSEAVMGAFPEAGGQQRAVGPAHGAKASVHCYGDFGPRDATLPRGDAGSAARFFYAAKADGGDRIGSRHPTVKPVDLMQWLTRLVCPPGGRLLDPFAGTGTTGEAAWREGFSAVLIEREAAYCDDIRRRLSIAGSPSARRAVVATARAARAGGAGEGDLPLFAAGGDGPRTAAGGGR